MTGSWSQHRWGELATLEYGKALRKPERRDGPFQVFGTNGPIGYHDSFLAHGPGIIIGRKGAYREVHRSRGPFFVIDTAFYLQPKSGVEVDVDWAYYQLKTVDINRLDSGGAIPSTSREAFYDVPVSVPPLPVQRKIAAVLAAYDELIENNLRRIEILEEMAQAVYREWFANFRFPGHEDVALVDSPLGPIPEGWEVSRLGVVADYISRGISPKYDDESDAVVINQKCIRDNRVSFEPARTHSTAVKNEKVVRFGDVLVNSTGVGTLGRVAQVRRPVENVTVDSHVTIIRPPSTVEPEFWGRALIANEQVFESLGAGATGQTELRKSAVEATRILLPHSAVIEEYSDLVKPIDQLAENLTAQYSTLRATRDLLLPKLVSGELDVSELDIDTEWLAS